MSDRRNELAERHSRYVRHFPRLVQHGFPMLEFDRGWDGLVMELMDGIDRALTDEEAANFDIGQIKEKWGTLRFYWYHRGASGREGLMDRIEPLVQRAYQQSEITCMFCGEPGIFRPHAWAHVSCGRCEAEVRRKGRVNGGPPDDGG